MANLCGQPWCSELQIKVTDALDPIWAPFAASWYPSAHKRSSSSSRSLYNSQFGGACGSILGTSRVLEFYATVGAAAAWSWLYSHVDGVNLRNPTNPSAPSNQTKPNRSDTFPSHSIPSHQHRIASHRSFWFAHSTGRGSITDNNVPSSNCKNQLPISETSDMSA